MARGGGPPWVDHAVIDAAGPVGALVYVRNDSSDSVVFQVGTEVWLASNATSTWVSQRVVDVGEALAAAPLAQLNFGEVFAVFRTSHGAWHMEAFPTQEAPSAFARRFVPGDAGPTAVAVAGDFSLGAFAIGEGAAIYERFDSSTPVLTLPDRVTGMFERYRFCMYRPEPGARRSSTQPGAITR